MKTRTKVVKGWAVYSKVWESHRTTGEPQQVIRPISRTYHCEDAARQFLDLYQRAQVGEAWVSAVEGFETRKGAPEPAL